MSFNIVFVVVFNNVINIFDKIFMQYKLHNPHEILKFFPLRIKHVPKLSNSTH